MRLYPDLFARRFSWLTIDLLMGAWTVIWILVARAVDRLILRLDALAQGVIKAGHTFDDWLISFQQAVPANVPFLSDFVRRQAELLRLHTGAPLVAFGETGSQAIHWLALLVAILVAAVPLSLAFYAYVPRRVRLIYDMRGVHRTLRRALAQPQMSPQVLELLAARAIYTMPYNRLLRYSRNPVGDWYARRFEPLARAELERHGLSVERYFRQLPGAHIDRQLDRPA